MDITKYGTVSEAEAAFAALYKAAMKAHGGKPFSVCRNGRDNIVYTEVTANGKANKIPAKSNSSVNSVFARITGTGFTGIDCGSTSRDETVTFII